jgi:hypothetical protein
MSEESEEKSSEHRPDDETLALSLKGLSVGPNGSILSPRRRSDSLTKNRIHQAKVVDQALAGGRETSILAIRGLTSQMIDSVFEDVLAKLGGGTPRTPR